MSDDDYEVLFHAMYEGSEREQEDKRAEELFGLNGEEDEDA